jgi:hypothetical protein
MNIVDEDAMTLIAQRDIKAGEEITISYFLPADDILLDRPGRQARLRERQEMFGLSRWECRCELCTASDADVSASDKIRLKIRDVKARFMAAASVEKQQMVERQVMIQLGKQDGLGPYHALGEEVILKFSK